MIACTCMVQEGQIEPSVEASIRSKLGAFSQDAFGEQAAINWIAIKRGGGFTAGEPSTSSLVSFRSNAPLSSEDRITMLNQVCDLWMGETHCSINEIVVSISDPETH